MMPTVHARVLRPLTFVLVLASLGLADADTQPTPSFDATTLLPLNIFGQTSCHGYLNVTRFVKPRLSQDATLVSGEEQVTDSIRGLGNFDATGVETHTVFPDRSPVFLGGQGDTAPPS